MNGQQETLGANAPPKPKTSKARLDAANDRARARRSIVAGGKGKKAAAASATPAVQPVAVKTKKGTVKLNAAALKVNNAKAPSAEILEELAARFVLNCPAEELNSFERILFLVEQAHWYYEDFVREEEEHKHRLKSMSLKQFAGLMFNKCAPLRRYKDKVDDIYKAFTNYKLSVPVGGIIILNPDMSKVLMVKTWKGSSWGFPKGKINKDEPESVCAAREVLEEVGVDFSAYVRDEDSIVMNRVVDHETGLKQRSRLFIVAGVSEETGFATQTRKEIGAIAWHPISTLAGGVVAGGKYFFVKPYVQPLLKWIKASKKKRKRGGAGGGGKGAPGGGLGAPASPAGQTGGGAAFEPAAQYTPKGAKAPAARFPSFLGFVFDRVRRVLSHTGPHTTPSAW
ncbi:mRNA decapping protein 2 [Micromonas pusilla CCMP1545]|uniref:mRNA decapping protein 2 n=1 Tax=Micromonas pusilla (strain CCMP1545) TaxID=564608 RepID=C1MSG0_MICPC|nr:mRNA decapping protein 2 [Micromonas pusilla CCMP1545]EEH57127.1 mRNA decapping protein 2 [Micromonas pusilla CCMP1545]|eukprot:XP_003058672.1 mRNA decapping protein 2 [Micromonas pusilla CCMP1545]